MSIEAKLLKKIPANEPSNISEIKFIQSNWNLSLDVLNYAIVQHMQINNYNSYNKRKNKTCVITPTEKAFYDLEHSFMIKII